MKNILSAVKIMPLLVLLVPIIIFSNVNAASRSDCEGHANSSECKQQIDSQCAGKPSQEEQQCIKDVLSQYPTNGIGTDKVDNCPTGSGGANAFNPSGNCVTALPQVAGNQEQVRNGLALAFGIGAAISLVSISIAAFNFATAATDAEKISRSKKTILFSIIGLVVTLSAEAIVLTVVGHI